MLSRLLILLILLFKEFDRGGGLAIGDVEDVEEEEEEEVRDDFGPSI